LTERSVAAQVRARTSPRVADSLGSREARAYYSPMDRSSAPVVQSAADVSSSLTPRTAEMSADIYGLIVRQIPQLRGDKRVLTLLEVSVGENVATVLHIIQHGIELENVYAPAAAEEYARRLAQRGVPASALLRAYRIAISAYIDKVLEELLSADTAQERGREDR
jgi:hypothetical protein